MHEEATFTLSFGQRFQGADWTPSSFSFPLHSWQVNSPINMHSPQQPGSYVFASEIEWWVYLKRHPGGQCSYFHHLCEFSYSSGRLPGRPCVRERGGRLDPKVSRNSGVRNQNSVLSTESKTLHEDQPGKRMNESLWAGLLGWHPCDPDGIEQLCSVSKEHRITCVLGVLRIHQWG